MDMIQNPQSQSDGRFLRENFSSVTVLLRHTGRPIPVGGRLCWRYDPRAERAGADQVNDISNDKKPRLRLAWMLSGGVAERDWLEYLLGDFAIEHVVPEKYPIPLTDGTIYVVSTNVMRLSDLPDRLQGLHPRTGSATGVGLIHLSDEWYGQDYGYYSSFDFVLRNHFSKSLRRPGVLQFPLGLPRVTPVPQPTVPQTSRRYVWSFCGNRVASRFEMLSVFDGLGPAYVLPQGQRIPRDEFQDVLQQSKFVPCPMGNVMLETWRAYEALEAGCIPLLERRATMDYYRNLLGDHPIPTFSSWREARRFVCRQLETPAELQQRQRELLQWWSGAKEAWRKRVTEFVRYGLSGGHRNDLANFSFLPRPARRLWQYSELARHHTSRALLRRAGLMLSRSVAGRAKGLRGN
jgi:hypothetical protein